MLGRVGLPEPVIELAARRWDVVVVGGGHNGLTAAAYLARAGRSVLVLEAREQLGGAATLDRPFADDRYLVSPCAYVVGLLHPLVVEELGLRRHGFDLVLLDPGLWCPFPDGTSIAVYADAERTLAQVAALAPADVDGFRAYEALFERIRRALRTGPRDTWVGPSPDRAELAELLDPEARDVLLHRSIADVVEEHVRDERLRALLHGQGVIGTWAGPRDPGTAGVHAMHAMGTLADGRWGYVRGGTGRVSFALADAAREHGAVLASGVPVAAIEPGVGVRLVGGELIRAAVVVSNADPKRTTELCASDVPTAWRARVAEWRSTSPVLKINCALSRLPEFPAAPEPGLPHRAMVSITSGIDATQQAFERAVAGHPAPSWAEVYFPSAYDPTRRAARRPRDERVRPVRAVRPRRRHLGRAARRDRRRRVRRGGPLRAGRVRLRGRARGARAAGRRGPHRAHRRPHLPGRLPAGPDVGPPLRAAHRRTGPLPLRGRDAPRGQRDRGERPQRRDGGA